jgi:hypothetical protein
VYVTLHERHPDAAVVVPPRTDAVLSATAATTQRDRHIQAIAETGRMAWQRDSDYNQRACVNVWPAPSARSFCNPTLSVRFNVSGLGAELPAKMEIRAMRSS